MPHASRALRARASGPARTDAAQEEVSKGASPLIRASLNRLGRVRRRNGEKEGREIKMKRAIIFALVFLGGVAAPVSRVAYADYTSPQGEVQAP